MARIFEKTLFFKAKRPWDKKAKLLEVYKLQSNNLGNKCKAEVHNSWEQVLNDHFLETASSVDSILA